MMPKVFIGSSAERLSVANAIQQNLDRICHPEPWSQDIFKLTDATLTSLFNEALRVDFAIFVFAPDDVATMRREQKNIVRDNVLFELGLFMGQLGPDRCFIVMPRGSELHIPTDLLGITPATYDPTHDNLQAALGAACTTIAAHIKKEGSLRKRFTITDKDAISATWRQLLSVAGNNVRIFSGDASWAERDFELLACARNRGAPVSALCNRPFNVKTIGNVRDLLKAGVHVRFYSKYASTSVRALIIDSDPANPGFAMRIQKQPKTAREKIVGEPGSSEYYNYTANRYFPEEHKNEILLLRELFDGLYQKADPALILETQSLSMRTVVDHMRKSRIPHYKSVSDRDLSLKSLSLDELNACCKHVKHAKVQATLPLLAAYQHYKIDPFAPVRLSSAAVDALLLPPIVEDHGSSYTVVDGMHRLFSLFSSNPALKATCLVVKHSAPLPSEPVPFNSVTVTMRKLRRVDSFPNFVEKNFRPIKQLDSVLHSAFRER